MEFEKQRREYLHVHNHRTFKERHEPHILQNVAVVLEEEAEQTEADAVCSRIETQIEAVAQRLTETKTALDATIVLQQTECRGINQNTGQQYAKISDTIRGLVFKISVYRKRLKALDLLLSLSDSDIWEHVQEASATAKTANNVARRDVLACLATLEEQEKDEEEGDGEDEVIEERKNLQETQVKETEERIAHLPDQEAFGTGTLQESDQKSDSVHVSVHVCQSKAEEYMARCQERKKFWQMQVFGFDVDEAKLETAEKVQVKEKITLLEDDCKQTADMSMQQMSLPQMTSSHMLGMHVIMQEKGKNFDDDNKQGEKNAARCEQQPIAEHVLISKVAPHTGMCVKLAQALSQTPVLEVNTGGNRTRISGVGWKEGGDVEKTATQKVSDHHLDRHGKMHVEKPRHEEKEQESQEEYNSEQESGEWTRQGDNVTSDRKQEDFATRPSDLSPRDTTCITEDGIVVNGESKQHRRRRLQKGRRFRMDELKRQTELLGERVRTLCKIPLVQEQGTSGKAEENLIVENAFTHEVPHKVRKKNMAMSALLCGDDGQTVDEHMLQTSLSEMTLSQIQGMHIIYESGNEEKDETAGNSVKDESITIKNTREKFEQSALLKSGAEVVQNAKRRGKKEMHNRRRQRVEQLKRETEQLEERVKAIFSRGMEGGGRVGEK